jgi:TolB protein
MTDHLRDSLHDLADEVETTDMYARAVHRSRRIARREATIGTAAALTALALLASGLWRLPSHGSTRDTPLTLRSSSTPTVEREPASAPPAAGRAPTPGPHSGSHSRTPARRKDQPRVDATTATPKSRSLTDIPGHVFYQQSGTQPDVVRLSPKKGSTETVLSDAPSPVGISPDGSRIAYAVDGALMVGETGRAQTQQVAAGISTAGQAPVWSPTGDRLLVDTSSPAILQVDSGTLTPLTGGLAAGKHFRWSGDGSKLVYATAYCSLKVATGDSDATVPVLGDRQPADNPDGLAACKPTSVDATGDHVTVPLETTGDIGTASPDTADAVVDTNTGDVEPIAVAGIVVGAVFDPDGNLLVRSRAGDGTVLSLFSPGGKLLVQASEPAAVSDLGLLAYTR